MDHELLKVKYDFIDRIMLMREISDDPVEKAKLTKQILRLTASIERELTK